VKICENRNIGISIEESLVSSKISAATQYQYGENISGVSAENMAANVINNVMRHQNNG
jgi:hypothetical protein